MTPSPYSIIHRTADQEAEDIQAAFDNFKNEKWKTWPNEGAFEGLEIHHGPINLNVKGNIPTWASGAIYRTGPGQSTVETDSGRKHHVSHWFDGFAQTHKFDIACDHQGQVSVVYSARGQSDEHIASVKKHGWRSSISFGQRADPCVGLFAKFMSVFIPAEQNNNVAFIPNLPGRLDEKPTGHRSDLSSLYLVTDNNVLQKIDPETLEPLGFARQTTLHPLLKGVLSSAHAQRDPANGDMFNFNTDFAGRQATYRVFKVSASTGETEILATIASSELPPAYIHSFFLSENYVILCVPVSHFSWRGLKILWERNLIDAIQPFDESQRCKWIIIDRRHGKGEVARFSTPARFFFHSVNAFEETTVDETTGAKATKISLDVINYRNSDIMFSLYYDILKNENGAYEKHMLPNDRYKSSMLYLTRYEFTLPNAAQEANSFTNEAREVFAIPSPHVGDLPTINPKLAGRPYRYVYSATNHGRSVLIDSIVKTDVVNRSAVIYNGPVGHTPGEPIFVPRPGGADEDDGVLMTVVLDGSARTSYLLCLDAKTLEEVGRAETTFPIALGLHGFHAPSTDGLAHL